MNLGSLAQNIGLSTGNVVMEDASLQQQYAQTEAVKSETAMRKMTMMMQQKELENNQFRAQDFASKMQASQKGLSTTDQIAQAATKVESDLFSRGDFTGGLEMAKIAAGATAESKAQTLEIAQQQKVREEAAGKAAIGYLDSIQPDSDPAQREAAADNLRKAALAAGLKPPPTTSPAFASFAKQTTTAGMTSEKITEFQQKKKEVEDKAAERKEEFNRTDQERRDRQAELVQQREIENARKKSEDAERAVEKRMMMGIMEMNADTRRLAEEDRKAAREEKAAAGGLKLSAPQKAIIDGVGSMVGEGVRTTGTLSRMLNNATAGAFQNLDSHTALESLGKAGANILTPENVQVYQVAGTGFGRAVLAAETIGLTRSPTGAQIEDMQKAVVPQVGDTVFTAAYKLATGNAIMLNRAERTHDNPDPKLQKLFESDLTKMRAMPTPEEVYEASLKDPASRAQIAKLGGTMTETLKNIRSIPKAPEAPAQETSKPLPPGVISAADYFNR